MTNTQLIQALQETRTCMLELIADLSDEQMIAPRLAIVNPLRWEIAHVAWFQEYWLLRHLRQLKPVLSQGDRLYDSARVVHDKRWDLPLPSKAETINYMQRILDRVLDQTQVGAAAEVNGHDDAYFHQLALFHEDMHAEAITYTRQTLSYPMPHLTIAHGNLHTGRRTKDEEAASPSSPSIERLGDAEIPGGNFLLGSTQDAPFVFDNEMWAHPIEVKPFAISRTAVTNAEFAAFVCDDGYRRPEFWTEEGWRRRSAPWFGDHNVLRGGCWATRSRLIRNNYRNFYKPDRRDVWAGFRTCAMSNKR
ncbi:MAG: SUMF1/EgtB/PvdO family nonheme iron enzyme [Acidobacteria bacterium]|nr:SUMF1/EgtB/PvdO family nonheme iron enzyme [Acidobacteriota bacterium]